MKRILTLLLLLVIGSQILLAQVAVNDRRPLWVGLDMGGTWQTSDMKAVGGIGWSFTLSQYSRLSKPGLLYWGWRFRFMDGRNYGYNYHALTGIQNNPVLASGATNYAYAAPAQNSMGNGFVYSNYKMRFDEFSFELIVGSNSLRKHGVLLYGFGAAGLNYWQTKTDQLGLLDEMYDYTSINSNGDQQAVRDQLDLMRDHRYETDANGTGAQWSFMPSAGFGMGYQWGNGFAIGVEHRTTFALNDIIDGVKHDYAGNATSPKNDQYHYDGLFIRWTFGGNSESHTTDNPPPPPPNPNTYTQNPPPNNPVVTNPPPNNPPPNNPQNNPPPNNNPPPVYPPNVRFTTPAVEPYSTNVQTQQLVVRVDNVSYSSQIQLLINNQPSSNFSFNPNNSTMAFTHTLMPGTNTYQVTATNQGGTASDLQTIIYTSTTQPQPTAVPPQVTITNPPTDPYTSAVQTMTVNATVLNVSSASNIQIRRNSVAINNFSFDPNTHIVSFTANLQNGSNLYEVIGTNTVGSASDAVTINYNPVSPPVVTITNPASCPFSVKTAVTTVTASITNVTTASQVNVVFNGQPVTNFSFTTTSTGANISFQANLVAGNNPFTITGTNTAGTNSKSCVITYKVTAAPPPVVTITNPASCPFTVKNAVTTITASITNVTAANQVNVVFNGQPVTNFNFSTTATGANISFQANLNSGNNPFSITGTNSVGTDSKSCTVVYNLTPSVAPPVVTITKPAPCPLIVTTSSTVVNASITNVTTVSQVTIVLNNQSVTNFTFTPTLSGANISFNANLVAGNNPFTITATNTAGSDSKSCVITYNAVQPPVVTITSPSSCPFTVKTSTSTISASITNVTTASQVNVVLNGQPVTNFSFTTTSSGANISFPANLVAGNNPFTITGTNTAGTNSKSCVIIYRVTLPPPVVTITNPPSSPHTSTSPHMQLTATVMNVAGQNEITVAFNNTNVTNFTYNTSSHIVTYNATFINGNNTFTVSAANANGSDSKTATIIYNTVILVQPPVVNILTPSSNPFITSDSTENVIAEVLNVGTASQITVTTLTNQPVNFNFNASTHRVGFVAHLTPGANQYIITATNVSGTASDNTTIKLVQSNGSGNSTPPGSGNGSGVTIQLVSPSSASSTASTASIPVSMIITGISSASEAGVRVNNVNVVSKTYNPTTHTLSFTANLNAGSNTIAVTVQNSNGSASQTLTVSYATGKTSGGSGKTSGSSGSGKSTSGSSGSSGRSGSSTPKPKTDTGATKPGGSGRGSTTTPGSTTKPR